MSPVKINVGEGFLKIGWDDGSKSSIKAANLRRLCPCAICREERKTQGQSYIPLYNKDEMQIIDIKIIGNYSLNIKWKDGHDTGLYEFNYLKSISN